MTDTKVLQGWWKDNYAQWKVVLWRAGRAFVASFLTTFLGLLSAAGVENFKGLEALYSFFLSCLVGAGSAGFIAVGKILRDKFESEGWLQKLPI